MSTGSAPQYQQSMSPAVEKAMSNSELLDVILNTNEPNAKQKQMTQWFDVNHESVELLLPDLMKGQGQRLTRRAMMTMASKPELQEVPVREFIRCVLEAAEYGFAIDGKLAYVVKYGGRSQCYSCQFDYKALIAVAKRTGLIHSIDCDVVCVNDHFIHSRQNGISVLEHTFRLEIPRGQVIGAYARVWHRDGSWSYEVMTREQLDQVQATSPAGNGPWKTWPDEMRKKTVIKRILKRYREDPALSRMIDMDDIEFDRDPTADMEVPSLEAVIDRTQSRAQLLAAQEAARKQQNPRKREEPKQEDPTKQEETKEEVESQDSIPEDNSPNRDGELSDFDSAKQDIENAPDPMKCKAAFEEWMAKLTDDGDKADLQAVYDTRLKSYPTTPTTKGKKSDGQKGLPLEA